MAAKKEKEEIKALFDAQDVDGNGSIDRSDLKTFFVEICCIPQDEAETMAADAMDADPNGDGKITWDEFCLLMGFNKDKAEIKALFDAHDVDGNGSIDRKDLKKFFRDECGFSEKEAEELTADAMKGDISGDGKITWDEFCQLMGY